MATSYLKRTPSSPGSNTTGTVSAWVKYDLSAQGTIIGGNEGSSSTDRSLFSIQSDGTVYNQIVDGGSVYTQISDRLLRDPAAWYHVVFQFDTSNGVQADRVKTFINNEQITSWSTTASWPSSVDIKLWDSAASAEYMIGCRKSSSSYQYFLSGNMAHVHVVDGTIYAPSVFAETDSTSGIWIPITAPSVTYGTNGGFYKFASGALGTDSAGSNNMTAVGDLVSVKDNPDNNFCTMNPLNNYFFNGTYSNGNNTVATDVKCWNSTTLGVSSGKWYWETKIVSSTSGSDWTVGFAGITATGASDDGGSTEGTDVFHYRATGAVWNNGSTSLTTTSYTSGDIISIALDLTNNKWYVGKNGTWLNSGDPTSGATGTGAVGTTTASGSTTAGAYFPSVSYLDASQSGTFSTNFGNGYFGTTSTGTTEADDAGIGVFKYDVPAGYYTLCTNNLGDQS